jgi:hypothetical protein
VDVPLTRGQRISAGIVRAILLTGRFFFYWFGAHRDGVTVTCPRVAVADRGVAVASAHILD